MSNKPLIIVGSGIGAYSVAKAYRKLAPEAPMMLITASDGAFYSKPQLSTALTQDKTSETLVINHVAQCTHIHHNTSSSCLHSAHIFIMYWKMLHSAAFLLSY